MLTIYRELWTRKLCRRFSARTTTSTFIPTLTMAFSAVYYMTNYAMKHDVSQYQLNLSRRAGRQLAMGGEKGNSISFEPQK